MSADIDTGLALRVRAYLIDLAGQRDRVTYQALARAMDLSPPNTINQITIALEHLMYQDAAVDRPFIAALVVSKGRREVPAPGFFICANQVGRFDGDPSGAEAVAFHTAEFDRAVAFWRSGTTAI